MPVLANAFTTGAWWGLFIFVVWPIVGLLTWVLFCRLSGFADPPAGRPAGRYRRGSRS